VTTDKIVGPSKIEQLNVTSLAEIFMYGFLGLAFLSSEIRTQTENKIIFKNN
jgi:hypothetical protein